MGQICPLPERIPLPDNKTLEDMKKHGIIIDSKYEKIIDGQSYVNYTLPKGWKLVNDSDRECVINQYIVDSENMIQYTIYGTWKGTYDNSLEIEKIHQPRKFVKQNYQVRPSETSGTALLAKALDTVGDNIEGQNIVLQTASVLVDNKSKHE